MAYKDWTKSGQNRIEVSPTKEAIAREIFYLYFYFYFFLFCLNQ